MRKGSFLLSASPSFLRRRRDLLQSVEVQSASRRCWCSSSAQRLSLATCCTYRRHNSTTVAGSGDNEVDQHDNNRTLQQCEDFHAEVKEMFDEKVVFNKRLGMAVEFDPDAEHLLPASSSSSSGVNVNNLLSALPNLPPPPQSSTAINYHKVQRRSGGAIPPQYLLPPVLQLSMDPGLVGHYQHNRLHGGVMTSSLDTLGGLVVMHSHLMQHDREPVDQIIKRFSTLGTIDLRVAFLQKGVGERFTCRGHVTRHGGRIASVAMAFTNEKGAIIATGNGSYVVS